MSRGGFRLPPVVLALPVALALLGPAAYAAEPGDATPGTTPTPSVTATATPDPAAEEDEADGTGGEHPSAAPVPTEVPGEGAAATTEEPPAAEADDPDGTPEPVITAPPILDPVVKPAAPVLNLLAKVTTPTRAYLTYSYRPGCPVKPAQLRKISMNFWGFDGKVHRGELIVRAGQVDEMKRVFGAMLKAKFPIHRMGGVERYKGSDIRAMAADNTSAFNCRHVTGNPTRLSQHSYGNAIDVNTVENPYVTASRVYPAAGRKFLDRSPYRKGMILKGGVAARAFAREDWKWGARWRHPDYQHFSANGG